MEEKAPELIVQQNSLSNYIGKLFVLSTSKFQIEIRKNILVINTQFLDYDNFKGLCLDFISNFLNVVKPSVFYTGIVGNYDCGNIKNIKLPDLISRFANMDTFNLKFGIIDSNQYYVNHTLYCVKKCSF